MAQSEKVMQISKAERNAENKEDSVEKRYIEEVISQMRCKKARDMVAEELSAHIEDQTETYIQFGLSFEEARKRAVAQMGDPVEVGTSMDRIHRPRIDVRTIALIAALTVIGMGVQIIMLQTSLNEVGADGFLGETRSIVAIIRDSLLGFIVMLAVMFLDYSFLGKHPVALWISLLAVLFLLEISDMVWILWRLSSTNLSVLSAVMILLFGAIVYHYRQQGYSGIFKSLLWLAAGFLVLSRMSGISLSAAFTLFATGILTISFAVCKGWFAVKKRNAMFLLWGIWLIPLSGVVAALAAGFIGKAYQSARIRSFFNPYIDPKGGGYVTLNMRERLADMRLFGSAGEGDAYYWWYTLNYVMEEYGIVMGVVLMAFLALLFGKMLSALMKQQNRLGSLLGVGAIGYLVVSTLLHVLAALTLIPSTSAYLPFFTEGTNATIACYLLLGVYLSVHRNSMILSEKKCKPAWRLRLVAEQEK